MQGTTDRADVERVVRQVVLRHLRPEAAARPAPSPLVVNVSARHMHVCRADLDRLFGPGHKLTPLRPLHQHGHFAAEETVTLVGPEAPADLEPPHPGAAAEARARSSWPSATPSPSASRTFPLRLSGDIAGSAGGYVLGPAGLVEMKEGIIRAAMHVHMGPADAEHYGVRHKDMMRLRVGGPAGARLRARSGARGPVVPPRGPHGHRRGQRVRPPSDEGRGAAEGLRPSARQAERER